MAKILDVPYTEREKMAIFESIDGDIARISVSDDMQEILCHLNFAVDRLISVAYSRIVELTEEKNGTIDT